jgi:hypothetical protein
MSITAEFELAFWLLSNFLKYSRRSRIIGICEKVLEAVSNNGRLNMKKYWMRSIIEAVWPPRIFADGWEGEPSAHEKVLETGDTSQTYL